MATIYHDFEEQPTNALRLARARKYLTELRALISPELSADGKSMSVNVINDQIKSITARISELEAMPDANGGVNGGVSLARVRRSC